MSNSENDDLRPEYDLEKLGKGVRGKYAGRSRDATNIVRIDDDLQQFFPDAEAVNRALREYLEHKRQLAP